MKHCHKKFKRVSLTEEGVMNDDALPVYMARDGWRCYRIEYGSECGCPEGRVWLPRRIDPDKFEDFLNRLIRKGIK